MKKHDICLEIRCFVLILFSFICEGGHAVNLDSLLNELDVIVGDYKVYIEKREERISALKNRVLQCQNYKERYSANLLLFNEYNGFKSDSALSCIERGLKWAEENKDNYHILQSKIKLSYLFCCTGMYAESISVLSEVSAENVPDELLTEYYEAYMKVYSEMGFYTNSRKMSRKYYDLSASYKDSLLHVIDKSSFLYLTLKEAKYRDTFKADSALSVSDEIFMRINKGTPEYSLALYNRAMNYRAKNDLKRMKQYLALSAISDITQATNDQASLWMLAEALYRDGDINRAYKYIRYSWDAITFYNARLRSWQSSDVLSMIDATYQSLLEEKNTRLKNYIVFISILVFLFLVLILVIYKQYKKILGHRRVLKQNNIQLNELNEELLCTNKELNKVNSELSSLNIALNESNRVKEEYVGRFMTMCSLYIDQLDTERKRIYKKISTGKINEVLSELKSVENKENDLKELYQHFDHAFLQLYPNFIQDFNALLIEEGQIIPKKGELLTVELRIFALIRLGIEDSSKIAGFLHYSVNTIYNYRAKIKNRSKGNRDDFEKNVKLIGL